MSGELSTRLERLLPNGRGVWIPMDHGLSGYPEDGLNRMNEVVDAIIAGGADAIVCQKGVLTEQSVRTGWDGFVCHISASTAHGGLHVLPEFGEEVSDGLPVARHDGNGIPTQCELDHIHGGLNLPGG